MVGLSFCDFVGTREEKARMAEYRQKEWPRRFKVTFIWCLKQTSAAAALTSLLDMYCRMGPISGSWPCRSGKKVDALLSREKLL